MLWGYLYIRQAPWLSNYDVLRLYVYQTGTMAEYIWCCEAFYISDRHHGWVYMMFWGHLNIKKTLGLNNFDFVKVFGYQIVPLIINFYGWTLLGMGIILTPREYVQHNKSHVDKNIQNHRYEPCIKSIWDIIIWLL